MPLSDTVGFAVVTEGAIEVQLALIDEVTDDSLCFRRGKRVVRKLLGRRILNACISAPCRYGSDQQPQLQAWLLFPYLIQAA